MNAAGCFSICRLTFFFKKKISLIYLFKYHSTQNSYDSDFNHAPCLKNGHKAHWAVIIGCLVDEKNQVSKCISLNMDGVF